MPGDNRYPHLRKEGEGSSLIFERRGSAKLLDSTGYGAGGIGPGHPLAGPPARGRPPGRARAQALDYRADGRLERRLPEADDALEPVDGDPWRFFHLDRVLITPNRCLTTLFSTTSIPNSPRQLDAQELHFGYASVRSLRRCRHSISCSGGSQLFRRKPQNNSGRQGHMLSVCHKCAVAIFASP